LFSYRKKIMQIKRTTTVLAATLVSISFLLAGSLAQAMSISATTDALGISWTLSATDDVDAAYAASYEVMFSVQADIPTDLSLLMDDGETINPTRIQSVEGRIAGLDDFMLVDAPDGIVGWYDYTGPSANECKNNPGFDSACAEAMTDSDAAAITSSASHTWTWVGNVSDLEAIFAEDLSGLQRVGAHLENDKHRRGWNVSEEFSQAIPEPSAALVFGIGIAFTATRVRRTARLS
jgi:hypothetical protein